MSGGEIICQGWLRKSPPEKKLRRYAWKKRWFILRSGRMSGDPDVLEYYKSDHAKKPIRIIDLHCCEQVDAGLTFKRKEFQDSFVFDIKTAERTFYLVAETEEEMNRWVRSICQLCGFNQSEDNHHDERSSTTHISRSLANDMGGSLAPLIGERKTSVPAHSSQPMLFTFDIPVRHSHSTLSNSAPQDYLFLHQCMSRKSESARSASFSQASRSSLLVGSDSAVQRLTHGFSHCLNGMGAQLHGFYSLPKPGKNQQPSSRTDLRDACYVLPRGYSSEGASELDSDDVYTYKTPNNTLAAPQTNEQRALDNYDLPSISSSIYQIPRTFDKNHNALMPSSADSTNAPPPRPPKPSQGSETRWGSPLSVGAQNGEVATVSVIPRRNTLPAVENIKLHRGSSFETSSHQRPVYFNNSDQSVESVNDGFSSYLRTKAPLTRSDSAGSEDNYVPMNPGSSSSPLSAALADSPKNNYIPMSPGPHHFDFPGFSATLPARKGSTASLCLRPGRLSDVTPPPINRNLKPNRTAKPTPLDLRNNGIIDELPFKSPITMSWIRPTPVNSISSQPCRPISTQSITSTDSADSEENYVAMQNPVSTSPAMSGTSSPAPRNCGNVDYLALDFQPGSPGPHRKPSTSSVTSDEKVDYVQVDKEKTQALQNTMQEWTDVRQSSEPAKGIKS
ncbi:GRB2-associated-binding protein 2 isoform X1 [Labeo rohita]|uniref:GRB2-associated-binding protein 2 isoform X1 n=1 Tax=Labeo rohita TaxID=84645 RepID=UPI0021E20007|nr:GRB2-associated-binding protein 2 isoform X1 [Labeo rohita]